MAPSPGYRLMRSSVMLSRAAAGIAVVIAIAALAGWAFDIEVFKSVFPGFPTMKPNTALCFLASGIALWLIGRGTSGVLFGKLCAAFVVTVAGITAIQYSFGWDIGVDQLLFRNAITATNIPYVGRMAPVTAGLFALLGMALLLLDFETPDGWWPSGYMALAAMLGGVVALLGYLYSVQAISEFHVYTAVALHSCILFVLLGMGTAFSRPGRSPVETVVSGYAGGVMARILLPMAVVMPYVNGWLRQAGERAGLYSSGTGMAAFSAGYIVLFSTVVWLIARNTNRIDEERRATQEHDAKLAAIVDYSGDAIIGTTLEGVITSWNKGAETMYGYTAEEAIGRTGVALLIPGGREEEPQMLISEIGQGRAVLGYETMRRRKDGLLVRVSLTISPVADKQGAITGGAIIARDITASKRTEADLRASEDRLREHARILDLAQVLVRDQDGRIVLWNRGAELLYGFTQQEAMGRVSHDLLRSEFPEPLEEVEQKLRGVGAWEGELIHYKKDGTRLVVYSKWVLHAAAGKTPRVLEANTDITALKRAEDSLIQAQKMQAIGTLAGGIAHDFNNILLAISGHAGFAAEDLDSDHPVQKDIAEITRASMRASNLVKQILTFSRREDTKRSTVRLQPVVEEALQMLRSTLPAMIEINTSYDAAAGEVLADATQIHQIVLNLCTNAAHAMGGSGGLLEVTLARVNVDDELARVSNDLHKGRYVRLSVSDSGCGMDPATLKRIFDPFFTTKPPGKGTGLGLAVVHGIVKSHGGAVTVYSEPGRGTTFHLYFPAAEVSQPDEDEKASSIPRGEGQHVLCVDDEKPILSVITRMLERLGYRVTGHQEASSALQEFRARSGDFDIVVSDLALRGMSGLDLSESLRRIRPDVPIVMTSGHFSPEDADRAQKIGIRDLILKPNTLDELGAALHRALRKH